MSLVRLSQSTGKDGMASIEQVKAALAQAADQSNTTTTHIRAAIEGTEQDPKTAGRIQGLTILHTLDGGAIADDELDDLLAEAAALASRVQPGRP